ncbi:recombination regulator RecX [Haloimpatiens sp. FM7330]|uniref:recombination regulator RecX n=1 Tax=Haloimpatiens sp. FM7330 TaxID=3298610 RepID=UPI003637B555
MRKIVTKIEVQKRNNERVNVYINDEFAFACSAELIYIHNLKKGKEVDLNYLKEIIEEDNYMKGKNYALRLVEKNYKTENEIKEKLLKKEYSEKNIFRILNFLKEYKFVDDNKYAEIYIKEKIRKYGKNKIKYKLLKKGVSEEVIITRLDNISKEVEYENALKLAEKKFEVLIKSENNVKKIYKKLGDYLVRNGYDFEVVNQVLCKVIDKDKIFEENNLQNKKGLSINNNSVNNKISKKKEIKNHENIKEIAMKRYNIIIKSENDKMKIYRRLSNYLARRGYNWGDIRKTLDDIL